MRSILRHFCHSLNIKYFLRNARILSCGLYLADSCQGAIWSIWGLLIGEPPTPKAVHGVGGDGVAELLEGVVSVPALLDLVEQFRQLACHCIIWKEGRGRRVRNISKVCRSISMKQVPITAGINDIKLHN